MVDNGLKLLDNARQVFSILADNEIIWGKIANRLAVAYGFRNTIIDDYDKTDYDRLVIDHKNSSRNFNSLLLKLKDF